jgi:TonB family protein
LKTLRILLLTFFTLVFAVFVYAQSPHVHTRYVNDSNKTIVQTDWTHLLNTPQQFVELILNTQYAGRQLKNSPGKVDLLIWSFSRDVMHKESKYQKLRVKTDGESWSIDPKTYLVFKGETKNSQDIFWEEKRPLVGQPSGLPASARIKGEQGINGLFMEQFYYQLKLDELLKIATAKTVEVQLGVTNLSFSMNQLNTIRGFLSQVSPSFRYEQNRMESAQQASASQGQSTSDVVDEGVINGKALSLPRPDYPATARSARASGVVQVLVTVDETGKVIAARAITGHPLLRDGAESAARRARFSPAIVAGQPVKITGTIIYSFTP